MNLIFKSVWAGIFATSAMTVSFLSFFKRLKPEDQSALPPATLTSELTEPVGLQNNVEPATRENMTMLMHFGYGIACSFLYSALPKKIKQKPLAAGVCYGVSIWSLSYLGLIPALNFKSSAYNMTASRNTLMIAAHVVWGAILGYSEKELSKRGNMIFDAYPVKRALP